MTTEESFARGAGLLGTMLAGVSNQLDAERFATHQAKSPHRFHPLSPSEAQEQAVMATSTVMGVVLLALCEATGQDFAAIMERAAQLLGPILPMAVDPDPAP